jgi:hypothetical protein
VGVRASRAGERTADAPGFDETVDETNVNMNVLAIPAVTA